MNRKTLVILLLALLLGSLFVNGALGLALAGKRALLGDEDTGYTVTLVDGEADAEDLIAIVPLQGLIMEQPDSNGAGKGSVSSMVNLLKMLRKKDHLKGIILLVDSPGGGVTASDRIYHELMRFKAEKKVPVVALFEDVAASGGYYAAMAADHIMAHHTSITGSIGVISHFYNVADLMGKLGVKVNTVKSLNDEGKESFKDIGSPYRPMRPEERKLLQGLITEMWERFVGIVAEGRKGKLTLAEIRKIADGRVFTGPQALQLKLIDSLGYPEDAYKVARDLAKAPKAKVVRYSRGKSLIESFGLKATIPDFTSQMLPMKLETTPFLYLWSGHS